VRSGGGQPLEHGGEVLVVVVAELMAERELLAAPQPAITANESESAERRSHWAPPVVAAAGVVPGRVAGASLRDASERVAHHGAKATAIALAEREQVLTEELAHRAARHFAEATDDVYLGVLVDVGAAQVLLVAGGA